ncbi:hypothetical protein MRB53_038026 [Persea americana]|nr:hypothetical protein MRB53_038026 [Persea americana]
MPASVSSHASRVTQPARKRSRSRSQPARKPYNRLGEADLGPCAFEKHMPYEEWMLLEEELASGPAGRDGVVHLLASILGSRAAATSRWDTFTLSDPDVQFFTKQGVGGGHFCGYQNMQMLFSYKQASQCHGADTLNYQHDASLRSLDLLARVNKQRRAITPPHAAVATAVPVCFSEVPSIIVLQHWIHRAWQEGMALQNKVQTGSIFGTRKWIGSPELEVICAYTGIPIQFVICKPDHRLGHTAFDVLLDEVESYFHEQNPRESSSAARSHAGKPPLYLQMPGHSVTVIGIEHLYTRHNHLVRNLLVLDPGTRPPPMLHRLQAEAQAYTGYRQTWSKEWPIMHSPHPVDSLRPDQVERLLCDFRRGHNSYDHYEVFEIGMLAF